VNYEQAKFREQQQKEVEEAMIRQQQTEEEWLKKNGITKVKWGN
jgi:hypothetical protein